jgi:hypothetical protein
VFPDGDVGRRIVSSAVNIGPLGRNVVGRGPFRIVGVVADIHQAPLGQTGEPVIYHTIRQFPYRPMTLIARGSDTLGRDRRRCGPRCDARSDAAAEQRRDARRAVPRARRRRPPADVRADCRSRVLTGALAAIGVYGLLACLVNDRRRELAIRLALGAQPVALARLVTLQGLGLAATGVVAGSSSRNLRAGCCGRSSSRTETTDLAAIAVTAAILLSAAALACLAPALRAARVARWKACEASEPAPAPHIAMTTSVAEGSRSR